MTSDEHRQQRDRVLGSFVQTEDGRMCLHSSYAGHPLSRAVPQGTPTVGVLAQSIRELGEMMQAVDGLPDWRERLVELERLTDRVLERVESLRRLIVSEWADAMGANE